eukprot:GEZU01030062.1.p1 GENE.GEZU01030062.1~~GEZU01030062.1.p1  ORF type:complete len:135 (+),score=15.09 GEZU01030062.1:44-448(+)
MTTLHNLALATSPPATFSGERAMRKYEDAELDETVDLETILNELNERPSPLLVPKDELDFQIDMGKALNELDNENSKLSQELAKQEACNSAKSPRSPPTRYLRSGSGNSPRGPLRLLSPRKKEGYEPVTNNEAL